MHSRSGSTLEDVRPAASARRTAVGRRIVLALLGVVVAAATWTSFDWSLVLG